MSQFIAVSHLYLLLLLLFLAVFIHHDHFWFSLNLLNTTLSYFYRVFCMTLLFFIFIYHGFIELGFPTDNYSFDRVYPGLSRSSSSNFPFGKLVFVIFLWFLFFMLVFCFEHNANICVIIIYISVVSCVIISRFTSCKL